VRQLLQTHSVSYAQGLQLALEAQGIKAVLLDEEAPVYLGFAGRIRLMVARDADYKRAMEIIRVLELPSAPSEGAPTWRVQRLGLIVLACGFAIMVVGGPVTESGPRGLFYGVLGLAFATMVAGVTLIVLGPIRDRRTPK